jgi:hypothetical protein
MVNFKLKSYVVKNDPYKPQRRLEIESHIKVGIGG